MEKNIITRYERKWYGLIACLTVVVALILVAYSAFNILLISHGEGVAANPPAFYWPMIYILLALVGTLLIFTVALMAVHVRIKLNKKLSEALGSEMLRDSENRSTKVGFCVLIVLLAAFSLSGNFIPGLPAMFIMRFILITGVLSMLVAWLIYNK